MKATMVKIKNIAINCMGVFITIIFVFPIYLLITSAFKYQVDIFNPSRLIVFTITLENFQKAVSHYLVLTALRNSLLVTVGCIGIVLPVSILAAYALTRYEFRGRKMLALNILTIRILPPVVVAIPMFIMAHWLNLYNSLQILILVNSLANLPLAIWLLKTFISDIPVSLEEASMLDGCNRFQVLRYITIPLLIPGIIATVLFTFIFSWNELLFALFLTGGRDTRTLPLAAASTIKVGSMGITYWGEASAVAIIMLVPVLIVFVLAEKYLSRALTFGMVK